MKKCYLICGCFLLFISCQEKAKKDLHTSVNNGITYSVPMGDSIFQQKCASCHSLTKKFIGPPLKNYSKDNQLIIKFNKNTPQHMQFKLDSLELRILQYYISNNGY